MQRPADTPPFAAVTGATGFLGRHLVRALHAAGWRTLAVGRRPLADLPMDFAPWSLGQALPDAASGADCVFHLACATPLAADPKAAAAKDFEATRTIAEQLRSARGGGTAPLLVFISSQSAGPQARNEYGRQKFRIEEMLSEPGEISVRPGLIVSTPAAGVFGTMLSGIRAMPVLPDVGGNKAHQPVHVADLSKALVAIAERALAGDRARLWRIGVSEPVSFATLVRQTARRSRMREPAMLSFPGALSARVLGALPPTRSLAERINGIIALRPMDTADDLAALGIKLRPMVDPRADRRHRAVTAARRFLKPLSASGRVNPVAWRRLARALYQSELDLEKAPPPRWREPLGGFRFRPQSDAAMRLFEASREGQEERYREQPRWQTFLVLCLLGMREGFIGPFRIAATLVARLGR